ncbi:hypothetical protein [Kitasatospora sp. NPDC059327]|uniref:hypothetical protein n=1 Tax=Kitasatospora sp. NPDC059327 TaxID=3346803 RepID=UPI003698823F
MSRTRTTKIQIPHQRGRRGSSPTAHVLDLGAGTAPLILVVPQRRSIGDRMVRSAGGALWRHRAAWAPTWAGLAVFGTAGLLSATAPGIALGLAVPALLLPAGWALTARRHPRSAVRRKARARTRAVTALAAVLAWSAAAVWFGPAQSALVLPWLAGTATAQTLWWRRRRALTVTPITPDPAAQD